MSTCASALAVALALAALPTAGQQPPAAGAPAAAPGTSAPAAAPAAPLEPQSAATAAAPVGADPQAAATSAPAPAAPRPMVALAGGNFRAGERVGHNFDPAWYRVGPFHLDATEVTVAEYDACVRAGRCKPAGTTIVSEGASKAVVKKWSAACNGNRPDRADHPVNCVDWSQARDYCAWASKRLPLEEEWEWAARGASEGTPYPWGDEPPEDRACWSGAGSDGGKRTGTCPVGSHRKGDSPSGVSDLAGSVWEWTATEDVIHADSRGRGGSPANIVRGGGWAEADPKNVTAGRRVKDLPSSRLADLGFRCARSR